MNVFSIVVGLICAVLMGIGLVPFLGWINWFVLGGCVAGIILGAFSDKKTGLTICAAVMAVGYLRLMLGGGFL